MDHGWGSFRTIDGDVSVGHDSIRIDRSPVKFLRGQRSRWRHGNRRQQLFATLKTLVFLVAPIFAIYQLSTISGPSIDVMAAVLLASVVLNLFTHWRQHSRTTTIRLSEIDDVTLDTDDRELTVTHEASDRLTRLTDGGDQRWFGPEGLFSMIETGDTETSVTLLADDDIREARASLQTRGISVDVDATEPKTETKHRFETKNGVVFCDRCGSQVSPNDRHCPRCDRTLRVEQPVADGSRELSTEF
jgi:hypothetical protein